MVIFNSYVKLPEGIRSNGILVWECLARKAQIHQVWRLQALPPGYRFETACCDVTSHKPQLFFYVFFVIHFCCAGLTRRWAGRTT